MTHIGGQMKEFFFHRGDIIFLNHGSFGACPREVLDDCHRWQREMEANPVEFLGRRSAELLKTARTALADELGTVPANLVFVSNSTTAINAVARSLDLKDGDEILTTDHEYGACENAWNHANATTGARLVRVPIPLPCPDDGELVERFRRSLTSRTKVLFFSHITSSTALIFPVQDICRLAREHGILSVIDGAHAPGQIPLDLDALGADVYAGNLHKWLCAPKGSAFLYARPEVQPRFHGNVISWGYSDRIIGHTDFDAYTGNTLFERRHQWQGTRDISPFLSVPAAIEFLARHRWSERRLELHAQATAAMHRFCKRSGLAPIGKDERFGLMAPIPVPEGTASELKRTLFEKYKIEIPVTSHKERLFVRLSLHLYNDGDDVEALLKALEELFPTASG